MDPEGIMLSEISQTEKDEYCVIWLISEKNELIETETRLVVARGRRWGRGGQMGEGGQKSYKINKFWGCNVQHGDYS